MVNPPLLNQKLKREGASKKVTKEDSFENRGYTTGPSVCARMSSSMDPPAPVATSAAPSQVGVTVQSFGFQSPVVVSQFSRGPPPLVHASISPLAITCGDTTPSSDTQEFPCTAQILSMTPLGPRWLQSTHLGLARHLRRTWPAFHSSFQAAAHMCSPCDIYIPAKVSNYNVYALSSCLLPYNSLCLRCML